MVRVSGGIVEEDGGAEPVGGGDRSGDGIEVVGEGGDEFGDVLAPTACDRSKRGSAGGESG